MPDISGPAALPTVLPARRSRRQSRLRFAAWMSLALLPLYALLLKPKGVEVQLQRKLWRLEIEVERQIPELGSAWCDELPAGAQVQGRRSVARQAAGAAMVSPPLPDPAATMAEHCRYTLPTWRTLWQARQEGVDPTPPRWPTPSLLEAQGPGGPSPQRLGARHEFYELELAAASGQVWRCRQPLANWRRLPQGMKFRLLIDRQGVADCASVPQLAAPPKAGAA